MYKNQYPNAKTDRASVVFRNNGFAHFLAQIRAQNLKFINSMQDMCILHPMYKNQYPNAKTDRASVVFRNNGFAHFLAQIFAQNLKFTFSMQDMCILHPMYKNQYPNATTDRASTEIVIFSISAFQHLYKSAK